MKKMKKILLVLGILLLPCVCWAFTAHVEFTPPTDPNYVTGVFVSETSGDYSECYGQLSLPGATTVDIGNIKPSATYYFSAKRYDPSTWESSPWSDEVEKIMLSEVAPIMIELPPLPMCDKTVSITVEIN